MSTARILCSPVARGAAAFTAAVLGVVGPSSPAVACGGFFCNSSSLVAVDQVKERVLFEVNDDDTLTVAVEVSYTGAPDGFSWVVPVPDTPDLGVLPPSTLRLLDTATSPRILPPDQTGWTWGDDDDAAGDDDLAGDDDDDDGVDVIDLPQVGPYDPTVVSSEDPAALVEWLNDNGYLITEEMEPLVAGYVAAGMKFLGLKLAPEAGVQDIAPIAMTYPGTEPMLPLTLTGVSAEPEMGVLVFIAGPGRYEALNYAALQVPTAMVQADPRNGDNNYFPLISYLSDQEGGRAFFTEWSDSGTMAGQLAAGSWLDTSDIQEAREYLAELADRSAWVTRLYARLNAREMITDPVFGLGSDPSASVSNIHDLRSRPPVHYEEWRAPALPCNDTYCGPGGSCAETEFGDGCLCEDGFNARLISGQSLSSQGAVPTVTCQDASFDLMASAGELIAANNPCDGYDCGTGNCMVQGGMPTCACDADTAAVAFQGRVRCVQAGATYGPEQLLWPDWPLQVEIGDDDDDDDDDDESGIRRTGDPRVMACADCSSSLGASGVGVGWVGLVGLVGLVRRRRV